MAKKVDLNESADYTLSESKEVDAEKGEMENSSEIAGQIREYLEQQGYGVTEGAKRLGKSGVEHTFDMLAQRDDGFTSYTIAIGVATGGDREVEIGTIFSLANKAYDCGILDRILVAVPGLSDEAKRLAQKQRIKVIDGQQIGQVLTLKPSKPVKSVERVSFETKEQLVESLTKRGYKIKEKAKIKGRSGIQYTFDILAHAEEGEIERRLGIDFLSADKEVSLEQVMLFDTKAYEVGIDEKVVLVLVAPSPEARQFAEQQHIKVFKLSQKPVFEPVVEELPSRPTEKPVRGAEKPVRTDKTRAKLLRQAPQPEALQLIPEAMARRYNAIPLSISGKTLEVAMADPTDIFALEALSAQARMRIRPVLATAQEVRDAIDFNYKGFGEIEKQVSSIDIPVEETDEKLAIRVTTDTPLVQALNLLVDEAVKARASDIHIEPEEDRLRVRYRIDGTLQDTMSLPLSIHRAIISRIKILGEMNIADHFRPQDGQFSTESKGRGIDVRVATAPTVWGETAVLRLLDKSLPALGLSELGMLPDSLARYESMLKVPYGMILISGPTGAGKTTSLYASISSLDTQGRNIVTIEDPAEYRFKDINQIQVNTQAGITFASGLRSILRLDPDVILVGEIRDAETANIAVQAALTGHLMLSSIHANDTTSVISRLVDLKVEPFLVASAVIGVVAQRMVRCICPDCGRQVEAPLVEQMAYEKEMGEKQTKFIYGTGCKSCAYTGYLKRTGIFEILSMSDAIGGMVCNEASSGAMRAQALKEGMTSMMNDGMRKVKDGMTTPAEVLRNAFVTT
ncbi:MAG: GspE/PulE family protein [Dehalococcoidia bacterium]|nr:GspE/PulE family protein [Dehalococcoidia bacterium]